MRDTEDPPVESEEPVLDPEDEDLVDLPLIASDRAVSGYQGVYPQNELWSVQFQVDGDALVRTPDLLNAGKRGRPIW